MPVAGNHLKSDLIDTFLECDLKQLQQQYHSIKEVSVAKKAFLCHQGDHCPDIFWLKSGIVKCFHTTEAGVETTISILGKGSVIGFFWNNAAHSEIEETVQALGETSFYRIAVHDFKALMAHQTELAWHIFEEINMRKQKIERRLRAVLTQSVERRVITTLLELADLFGIKCAHGYTLEIYLTQQEVADLVGASRSVVSTILNNFKSRGMLDYTREQICINDTELIKL